MEKHSKINKIIRFPNRKERRKILLEHEDRRVRAAATLRIAVGWLLIAGLILFIFANYTLLTPSSLRLIASYAVSGFRDYEDTISTIHYESGSYLDGELFGGGLAYTDSGSLFLAKPGSPPSLRLPLGYSSPVVETSENFVLVYDRGGTKATLSNASKRLCELTLESPILNGSLASNGHFVLVTASQGYRTAAALYDSSAKEIFRYDSSEYYIISAGLTPNCRTLAALGFRQDGVALTSRAMFFSAADGTPISTCDLTDSLAMELCPISNDNVAALCDDGLYLINMNGKAANILNFSSSDLLAFSSHENSIGLAVRSYSGSARSDIYAIRSNCKLKGPYGFDKEPSSIAVSNTGVAVLSAAGVCVYDFSFTPIWENPDAVGARRILLSDDNSVFAMYAKHTTMFSSHSSGSKPFQNAETSPEEDTPNAGA